jgi:hypothetical protein
VTAAPSGSFGVDAFLADSVAESGGKLYALGAGWNVLRATGIPVTHPRVGVGLIISVPYALTNREHNFCIRFQDEGGQVLGLGGDGDGEVLTTLAGTFSLGRPADLVEGDAQVVPVAANFDGLVFSRAGLYTIVVSVNEEELKHLAFRVQLAG